MKDKLINVLLLACVLINGEELNTEPETRCINNVQYDVEVLRTDLDRPYSLSVDYSTNTVFFSYSLNKVDDVFRTGYINLNTKEFGHIEGVDNGFAHTVDQKSHEIYIGSSSGIYKCNHNTKTAEFYVERGTDIWNIYFKDVLYFSTFPSQFLFTHYNGETVRFKDLQDTKVDQFVIDNEDVMFFTNATGLYGQKKGTEDARLYREYTTDGVRGLATDINGNVHFCRIDGIYAVDKASTSVVRIADQNGVYGLAFDNDNNIIYSDASKMVRLKVKKDKSC